MIERKRPPLHGAAEQLADMVRMERSRGDGAAEERLMLMSGEPLEIGRILRELEDGPLAPRRTGRSAAIFSESTWLAVGATRGPGIRVDALQPPKAAYTQERKEGGSARLEIYHPSAAEIAGAIDLLPESNCLPGPANSRPRWREGLWLTGVAVAVVVAALVSGWGIGV